MPASWRTGSNVPCTAMYRATAPGHPGHHQRHRAHRRQPGVALTAGPVAHPPLQRIDPPLGLGLGQVHPEGVHLGDSLEVVPHLGNLGLAVDLPGVEPVQELGALDRSEDELTLPVEPLSAERTLGVLCAARIHESGRGHSLPPCSAGGWPSGHGIGARASRGGKSQPTGRSVQDVLAAALRPWGGSARPMAAGRTDRGVHARCQPVSVRRRARWSCRRCGRIGGDDWGVSLAVPAPAGFHAQWSASMEGVPLPPRARPGAAGGWAVARLGGRSGIRASPARTWTWQSWSRRSPRRRGHATSPPSTLRRASGAPAPC